jgi:membrane protease YdiL (CAAX protease family)
MLILLKSIISTLIQIGFLLPLLFLIKRNYSKKQKRLLLLVAVIVLVEGLAAAGVKFTLFPHQQWNWTGKGATLIAAVLFVYCNPILSKNAIGFTNSFKPFSLYPIVGVSGIVLLLRLIVKITSHDFHLFNSLETFAFQATLPGFSEEIIYRGILMGLLHKVFPASISVFKARIGWSLLLVSVFFGLEHGIHFDKHWQLMFSSEKFCKTMGIGFVMGWLKQRSGSLLPAIVFHNLWNLIVFS